MFLEYHSIVKAFCEPQFAGGETTPDVQAIQFKAYNNPGFSGLLNEIASPETVGNGKVLRYQLSIEDVEALDEVASAEDVARDLQVRQEDGDSFSLICVSENVIKPDDRYQASPILSSGTEASWSFSESLTVGVSVSTEIGASLFEVFSASVSIEVSMEHTETIEKGMSFTVGNCPGEGVVYYYPLYTKYVGSWSSAPNRAWEAFIPMNQGDFVAGRFVTECLGS